MHVEPRLDVQRSLSRWHFFALAPSSLPLLLSNQATRSVENCERKEFHRQHPELEKCHLDAGHLKPLPAKSQGLIRLAKRHSHERVIIEAQNPPTNQPTHQTRPTTAGQRRISATRCATTAAAIKQAPCGAEGEGPDASVEGLPRSYKWAGVLISIQNASNVQQEKREREREVKQTYADV